MATYTIQQFKTMVATVPSGVDWFIEIPSDLTLPVLTDRVVTADGSVFYAVQGYVDLGNKVWTPT